MYQTNYIKWAPFNSIDNRVIWLNIQEIESFLEDDSKIIITMKSGKTYEIKDTIDKIIKTFEK